MCVSDVIMIDVVVVVACEANELPELFDVLSEWHGLYGTYFLGRDDMPSLDSRSPI